jgi:CRISPR-associated protein Csx17
LLKPFFVTDQVLVKIGFIPEGIKLSLRGEVLAWFAADQPQKAVDFAWAKLRQSGVELPHFPQQAPRVMGIDGAHLLAALMFPVAFGQLKGLLALKPREPADESLDLMSL